jgi:outer membrane receptor protein involved in Fe transport
VAPEASIRPAVVSQFRRLEINFQRPDPIRIACRFAGPVLRPAAPADGKSEKAIILTPFEVVDDIGDTYDATNTNSITGTNTPLSRTPLDARVFNRGLMDELGIVDTTKMLSEIGGLGPALIDGGSEGVRGMIEGDRQDFKAMTSRGLAISNPRREGFLRSEISLVDSFDIERVETLQGSNSLLFRSGSGRGQAAEC